MFCRVLDTPAAGMPGIFQDGERNPHLGIHQVIEGWLMLVAAAEAQRRDVEGVGIEAPVRSAFDLADDGHGPVRQSPVRNP